MIVLAFFLFNSVTIKAQVKKFDTTVKMGDQGYRVQCSNKNADENEVSIAPVGLKLDHSIPPFRIPGRIKKAITDDFNNDGLPDLAICIYSGGDNETGTVVALSYNADKSVAPVYFPDIYLDPKIREGYKGHDEFSALTGTLLRKFPIFLPNDAPDKPTGGNRTVQYGVMNNGNNSSFKVLRSFDTKPDK